MQRKTFEYLYIHANCLAELALLHVAGELDKEMADGARDLDSLAELKDDEMETMAREQLAKLDMSTMMDGNVWDNPESDAAVLKEIEGSPFHGELTETMPAGFVASMVEDADTDAQEFNLDVYLKRAYAAQEATLKARIDAALERVDMNRLKSLLSGLPGEYSSLGEPLSVTELEEWLTCYMSEHQMLTQLVILIRSLD